MLGQYTDNWTHIDTLGKQRMHTFRQLDTQTHSDNGHRLRARHTQWAYVLRTKHTDTLRELTMYTFTHLDRHTQRTGTHSYS